MSSPFNGYKRTGNRISLLPVSRFCAKAGELGESSGAGRSAAMSKAFHAALAKAPDAAKLRAALDQEERSEIDDWKTPPPLVFEEHGQQVTLDYESADKEVMLGIDDWGYYADPTQGDVLTRGYLDFGWVRIVGGRKVAYVCDIKRQEWTVSDGANTLQLVPYGFAYASLHGCDAYVPAIWLATEGEWIWGEWVDLGSPRAAELWSDAYYAITNTRGDYSTGAHCKSCYARLHCPEYVLPAVLAETELAAVANGCELTPELAARAVMWCDRIEDLRKRARENLQEAVRQGLRVQDPVSKKVWRIVDMPGRKGFDTEALRRDLGAKADQYVKQGAPYEQMRWVKG